MQAKAPIVVAEDFRTRAHRLIPGGAHTYSKGDEILPVNAPQAFVRGKGARVWDDQGHEYVDWGMGITNVPLGHAEPVVDQAAIAALLDGQNFSRPTPLEVQAAEAVLSLFDGMEMAKFAKNGSDANEAAIRLARAITGRDLIAYDKSAPFLSIHDWFIGNTVMNAGIPAATAQLAVPFRFNDLASVETLFAEHGPRLACVLLEPCRETRPAPGFLERLRALCDAHGALLIFDENVTCFRYHLRGAQSLFGVRPDFTSVGKGIANGYSLTALLGRREYMERGGTNHAHPRCFLLSTTNGAERSALAAGIAAMAFSVEHQVPDALAATGRALMDGLQTVAQRHGVADYVLLASDFPSRPLLRCLGPDRQPSPEYRTLFLQELLRLRVFMPWCAPSFRHGASEMDQTLEAFDAACAVYAQAIERRSTDGLLEGRPVKPVFRQFN